MHKFGIEVPKTVPEALALDKKNGNMLWADAIAKELKNVRVAFKILSDGQPAPIGHQKIPCHMIFDVKMEDFVLSWNLDTELHTIWDLNCITFGMVFQRYVKLVWQILLNFITS